MDPKVIDNNFKYHSPKEDQPAKYEAIRELAKSFAHFVNDVTPESREKALFFTHLETAVMWANASIARNE